jgi:uncharacterized damage-inducible protein DinB
MNADAFRHFFDYHMTANRKIWDKCVVPLTDEQFVRPVEYSVGSVRNQVVHMLDVDDGWFSGLLGLEDTPFLDPETISERDVIRKMWDDVETKMQGYLSDLQDDMLYQQPFLEKRGHTIKLWQVLLHLVNHGTDHRAQLLSILHELGVETFPQDYVFFIMGRL